jgi:hypothetical protein
LPIGKGKAFGSNMNPVLEAIVGGWQTNGIWTISSGNPLAPEEINSNPIPTYGQRPSLTATLQRASGSPERHVTNCDSCTSYFSNPDALTQTADFTLGNAPRTIASVRAPGQRNANLSLFKEFPLPRESMRLEFRAEAFNAFNHPFFNPPSVRVGSGRFGKVSSTPDGSERQVQLGLKLYF